MTIFSFNLGAIWVKLDREISATQSNITGLCLDYVSERLPMTFELTVGAMIFSTVFGLILGVVSALHRNSIIDTLTMLGANIGISMPVFWLGLMLAYIFAITFKGHSFFHSAFRAVDRRVFPAFFGDSLALTKFNRFSQVSCLTFYRIRWC